MSESTEGGAAPSKAEVQRQKRIAFAKQKFNRVVTETVGALEELTAHTRSTSGILTEEQAELMNGLIEGRVATLKGAIAAHVAAPVKVEKKAKATGISLF